MVHELKIAPEYFEEVDCGRKPFEVRIDDCPHPFAARDVLYLREWSGGVYTTRVTFKVVTYVLRDVAYCKTGYCILGLAPIESLSNLPAYGELAREYLEICAQDCKGDPSVGIPPCVFYTFPDIDKSGSAIFWGCRLGYFK